MEITEELLAKLGEDERDAVRALADRTDALEAQIKSVASAEAAANREFNDALWSALLTVSSDAERAEIWKAATSGVQSLAKEGAA